MASFFYSNLIETLGWTFLHSLWQGLLTVLILFSLVRIIAPQNAQVRYWLATMMMSLLVIVNVLTFFYLSQKQLVSDYSSTVFSGFSEFSFNQMSLLTDYSTSNGFISAVIPYLMMFWSVGVLCFLSKFLFGIWQIKRLRSTDTNKVPSNLEKLLVATQQTMGINKVIQWLESPHITTPMVIGHLKPVILFPIGLMSGLELHQIEAILAHELSHIKRFDFIVNIVQSFVEIVYYFNPFIWIISNQIRVEREHACDDHALTIGLSRNEYAMTLADIYEYQVRSSELSMTFSTGKKHTLKRIQRLMKTQKQHKNNKSIFGILLALVFVTLVYFSQIYPGNSAAQQGDLSLVPSLNNLIKPELTLEIASTNMETPEKPGLDLSEVTPMVTVVKDLDQVEAIVAIDTIDTDAIRKQADDFEAAMNELMSTQEWQKMKDLSLDMSRLNDELMEGLSPLLNEQVIEVLEMKEIAEMATRMMDDIDVDVDIDREELREVMEVRMKEMDVQMEELQLAMKEINLEGIQELQELAQMAAAEVQINAKELQIMSEKTRQMAEEVSVQADEIRAFNNRLISMLIADGYIDSKEDIDQIELREGIFYLNDEALKKKDQKKYLDLHQGYFGDDSFIFNFKN